MAKTDVAKTFDPEDSAFPVLFAQPGSGETLVEIVTENFGSPEEFDLGLLPRVKVPAGGGKAWEIPNEKPTDELDFVVVDRQNTRSMWFKSKDDVSAGEADSPPDCSSDDGMTGNIGGAFGLGSAEHPSGDCGTCPMNAFRTANKGEGKMCKEQLQVYGLTPGSLLPVQITLPPTSLRPWKAYMMTLISAGLSVYRVRTHLSLKNARSANGTTYSVIDPSFRRDEVLDKAEESAASEYATFIAEARRRMVERRAAMRSERVTADTIDGETDRAESAPVG